MTNLAIALRLRPDLATKIERLVFMGGAVEVQGNVTGEPSSTSGLIRKPPKRSCDLRFRRRSCSASTSRITRRSEKDYEQIVAVKTPITALYAEDMGNQFPAFNTNPDA